MEIKIDNGDKKISELSNDIILLTSSINTLKQELCERIDKSGNVDLISTEESRCTQGNEITEYNEQAHVESKNSEKI